MRRIILILLLATGLPAAAQLKTVLQPSAMKQDFAYLRKYLENTHPMLYMYHSRESMQHTMDSLDASIDQPLPFLEFYKKIAFLIARIGCEHTGVSVGEGMEKLIRSAGIFPYQLYFAPDKTWIQLTLTKNQDIKPGDELIAINNFPIDSIRRVLHQYIPADAHITSSKDVELSGMAFNFWYYLYVEQPDEFTITIKTTDGRLITKTVQSEKLNTLNKRAMQNPVNKSVLALAKRLTDWRKEPLRLEVLPGESAAILTVNSFVADMGMFRARLDSFFSVMKAAGTNRLIIDLSYNGGGEVELAADLLNYFISSPTSIVEYSYLITDRDEDLKMANIPEEILRSKYDYLEPLKNGKSYAKLSKYAGELKMLQPKEDRFTGQVFLYVNGGTASAASTFVAVMKSLGLATIVGQETGGGYWGGGTAIGLNLKLPNSGITAHTGLIYQRFQSTGGDPNRGVLPDFSYAPSFEDLLANKKSWRDFILGLKAAP